MAEMKDILRAEYSSEFDELRKNRIAVSYHKYGPAKTNYGAGLVDAIGSLEKCLDKFKQTSNTEYLLDVANYCMFRYMYPQGGEYFKATDSNDSAGIAGISIKEIEQYPREPDEYSWDGEGREHG